MSSNVHDEIILHKEQKIDPLGGISPKTERTFEELIFLEPELPDPDKDKEPIIMKTYSIDEKNTYASLITEALTNFPIGAALHPDSIYKAINAKYPEYKMDNPIWKADIRNNLSINKNFIQEDEYWKLASDIQHSNMLPSNLDISLASTSDNHENATIPTFSVNNLSRKAEDIFKESIGKKSEKVSKSVYDPNSEISSEDFKCVLSSNADEITVDEQKIDPLGSISPNVEGLKKMPSNNKLGSLPYNCDICHAYGYAVNNIIIIKHRKDCEKQNVM